MPLELDQPSTEQTRRLIETETQWAGVNARLDPAVLPDGFMSSARNMRFNTGQPTTRKGVTKPVWAHLTYSGDAKVYGYSNPMGFGAFKDPDSVPWMLVAGNNNIYRCRPYNSPVLMPMPTGVQIRSAVRFCQGFNKVYCFRGRYLKPLICRTVNNGWEDIIGLWDSTLAYLLPSFVAYGPWVSTSSVTQSGTTVTVVTSSVHNYITGQDVSISGDSVAGYNGRWNVTVVDDVTFTFETTAGLAASGGTPICSSQMQYWKSAGTTITLTSLASAATTATATKNNHGFETGDSVTIAGANQTEYNGTYTITKLTANTFSYTFAGSGTTPATGTITAHNLTRNIIGDTPVAPNWTRAYNLIPNADNAVYINNQMLIPTAYTPETADFVTYTGGSYTKKDFLVALDYGDEALFNFANEFRINQGSDDVIVDLVKFTDDTAIVFKDRSWAILSNIRIDLSQLTCDFRTTESGLVSIGGCVVAGQDCLFLSGKRGIISIRQTENGKIQSLDIPFSRDVQPLIDRIFWSTAKNTARLAYWDNKLYAAIPLDTSEVVSTTNLIPSGAMWTLDDGPTVQWTHYDLNVTVGQTYTFTPTGNLLYIKDGTTTIASGNFVAQHSVVTLHKTITIPPVLSQEYVNGAVYKVLTGVNNAVLIHDFTTGQWSGYDSGSAMTVKEFVKLDVGGVQRLLFLSPDGYVNLVEEGDCGDEVSDNSARGIGYEEITSYALTRGYGSNIDDFVRNAQLDITLATWNPSYSINLIYDGVAETRSVVSARTKDRTAYYRPFNAPAYVTSNVNGDFMTAFRQDYSPVLIDSSGLTPTNVRLGIFQQTTEDFRVHLGQGRSIQIEFTNTQGRVRIAATALAFIREREKKGTLS